MVLLHISYIIVKLENSQKTRIVVLADLAQIEDNNRLSGVTVSSSVYSFDNQEIQGSQHGVTEDRIQNTTPKIVEITLSDSF